MVPSVYSPNDPEDEQTNVVENSEPPENVRLLSSRKLQLKLLNILLQNSQLLHAVQPVLMLEHCIQVHQQGQAARTGNSATGRKWGSRTCWIFLEFTR